MTDCARIAKDYIKTLNEDKITELLEHPDFEYTEKWILYYTYVKERYVANTCMKLHLSEKQFFIHLREALIKLYYISNL